METTKYNRKPDEAARLSVGTRTLDRWVAGKVIPFRKIGRVLLFDPTEVDHALALRWRVAAVGEVKPKHINVAKGILA
jgi:excisionase family DNA binding protein